MHWLKEKLQDARELAAKPIEWAQANKYRPLAYYLKAKEYLDEAIKKAEAERDSNEKKL